MLLQSFDGRDHKPPLALQEPGDTTDTNQLIYYTIVPIEKVV
jgi:hypothetical protein